MPLNRTNRRERKKLTTRRLIRNTALSLFEVHGYANVTVEQISEAADVSPITFYRHFRTKEGVVISVVMTSELEQATTALFTAKDDADVSSIFDRLFSTSSTWADNLTRQLALIASTPELTDALWQRSTQWTDTIAATLTDGLTSRIFARCLIATMIECALAWATSSPSHDINELRQLTQTTVTPLILTLNQHQNTLQTTKY